MNRRNFLQLLAASGAFAATFDIEKLLWVPKPMIVVPEMPKVYTMGNLWVENWGDMIGIVTPSGMRQYFSQYEVDKALIDIYNRYQGIESKHSNKL